VASLTTLERAQALPVAIGVATAEIWLIGKEHSVRCPGVQAIWSQLILCGVRLMLMVVNTDLLVFSMLPSIGVASLATRWPGVVPSMTRCLPGVVPTLMTRCVPGVLPTLMIRCMPDVELTLMILSTVVPTLMTRCLPGAVLWAILCGAVLWAILC